MNKKWKILTTVGIFAVTCGLYTWGIPAIINIKANKALIEYEILEKTGYVVTLGNPEISMGMFPSIWLKSDNISLLNSDDSKALSIDNPKLKVKLFPLLFNRIEIQGISATKEYAFFALTKDKKLLLGDYPLNLNPKKNKLTLSKVDLNLGAYNIILDDRLNSQRTSLEGKYFKDGEYLKDKYINFATEGRINVGDKSTNYLADVEIKLPINNLTEDQLKIVADIKNFDIASISDYVSILTGGKIKELRGIVNFSAKTKSNKSKHKEISTILTTENLAIKGKDKASSIIYDDKLIAKINFSTILGGVKFKNTSINSKNIHAFVDGKVYDVGRKIPQLDITVEAKKSRLEDICAILPGSETLIPEFNLYKLKKYVFYGDGEGKVNFKGKANRPYVIGNVKISDAYLIKPILSATENAKIGLKFVGEKMFLDVHVPTTNNQLVTVTGMVKIDGSKYSELNIKSTDSVILAPAQVVLNPLHEILKFQLGPVPLMTIAGVGNIDMHTAGKKVDPHLWGDIRFRNVTASFNDIHNMVLKNGSGEVKFNDTQTTFKSYAGTINGKPVEIKGDCTVLGKLNVYVSTKGQQIAPLIKIINTSPILEEVQKVVAPFTKPTGIADVFLHMYGDVSNAEIVEFNKDLFAKGTIKLHNATTVMQDTYLPFTRVNGVVNFNQYDADYNINGFVRNSKIHVEGTASNSNIDLIAKSDKFSIKDCSDLLYPDLDLPFKKEVGNIDVSFVGGYKGIGDANKLDYNKVVVNGKFIPNMQSSNPIKINGGTFNIKNGVFTSSTLSGLFDNNPYTLSFVVTDIYDKMNIKNAVFNFKNFDVSAVNSIKKQIKLPKELSAQMDLVDDIKGVIDINGSIKNGHLRANTNLKNTSFNYKPINANIRVLNGFASVNDNTLHLNKINSKVGTMPVFVNGKISNIYKKPYIDLYVSGKPTQRFFDIVVNRKSVYPVKVRGDVSFNTKLHGYIDNISSVTNLNVAESSSLYYLGATLEGAPTGVISSEGMSTNPVAVVADAVLSPNRIKINSLQYNQIITSQNKKQHVQNQLNASGEVKLLKDNVAEFKNFRVKTNQPTDVKIFNLLLKKPTIKQGVFTSDLTINGTSLAPKILGTLNVTSINIPLLDATIRDVNVDFKHDFINIMAKGIVLTNDILAFAKIENKPVPPVVVDDAKIQMDVLNLNVLTDTLNDFEIDYTRNNLFKSKAENPISLVNQVIIKNAEVSADNILIKKAKATNFKSKMTLDSNHILRINNYDFNIANGTVNGKIDYDFNTLTGYGEMKINNADAQIIGENFFDMPGQMYGRVTGNMQMACKGLSSLECVNTLSGKGDFEVIDGKMPKLGSLEYLLKAGNLLTGGLTGLSISGIIDLITPLKTGNFKSISGHINVKDGIADDIQIYSRGKDLNMYLTGSYNIATLVADMEVYGSLSKNFSTILGRIGNASLNRLFSAIPGISINEINPKSTSNINKIPNFDKSNTLRVFKSEIYGDINGSNYVKSFRWIKD